MSGLVMHRMQCAAITRGCFSAIMWEDRTKEIDEAAERFLRLNGWREDHGRWVCGNDHSVPVGGESA